jgi:hypothetical protein
LGVVDDAQWLDRASARVLAFVARRLLAEKIAILFAAREPIDALAGFAELRIDPLGHRDARALLDSALQARLDERVMERIVVETHGNPLALLELPRGLTPAQLAGGFGLPDALPLSERIEESFARRLARLPRDARRLPLLAAADPTGDAALQWRAAGILGIADAASRAVESDGLVSFDAGVVFRHPLVRSAVYRAADPDDRRSAHGALAEATDPSIDPDRRAWHRAQAAVPARRGRRCRARAVRSARPGPWRLRGGRGLSGALVSPDRRSGQPGYPGTRRRRGRAAGGSPGQRAGARLDGGLGFPRREPTGAGRRAPRPDLVCGGSRERGAAAGARCGRAPRTDRRFRFVVQPASNTRRLGCAMKNNT